VRLAGPWASGRGLKEIKVYYYFLMEKHAVALMTRRAAVFWHASCSDLLSNSQRNTAMTCPLCASFLIPAALTIVAAYCVAALL
jgi:hypothetical protein